MGLLISIIVITIFVGAFVWRKELGAFIGRVWLYLVILKDVCMGKCSISHLYDTRQYRIHRSVKAVVDLEEFLLSPELALFAASNSKSRHKYHIPLWQLRENYYYIDLVQREVKCQCGNSTTGTSIRVVLEAFRDVYPDYDPYTCFRLRITDAMNMVEDFNKMED